MTIAAGFLCPDGIVLGADTLYSGENKRYAAKIWSIQKGDILVVFAGAGVATALGKFKDEAERSLNDSMTADDVLDKLDEVLSKLASKLKVVAGELPNLLVAVRTPTRGYALFENDRGLVLTHILKHSQCVGFGASLGLYFADSLFEEGMPVHWARIIAAHLLKQTKRYADGCGGDSQIVTIPPIGAVEQATPSEISDLEKYFGEIEDAMRMVLPTGDLTESTLVTHRFEILNTAIQRARQAGHVIAIPAGRISIVGDWISPMISAGFTSGPSTPLSLATSVKKPEDQ